MVIENVLKGKEPNGWAITEVVEKGDGAWAKVSGNDEFSHRLKLTGISGHHDRARRRQSRCLAGQHGLDRQARRQPAAGLACRPQSLKSSSEIVGDDDTLSLGRASCAVDIYWRGYFPFVRSIAVGNCF